MLEAKTWAAIEELQNENTKLKAALAAKENELERWKNIAQRNNASGCCCKIKDAGGDPKMIEPCAFHATWRDVALLAARAKYSAIRPE
jgi:hypothetical protein